MKKKFNKKNVPAYAFGMDQLSNYLGGAGILGSTLSGLGEEDSKANIAGGTLSGAASGASLGMALGPIGAAAGGVLGAVGGLFTGFKKKKALKEAKRRKETMTQTAMGLGNTAVTEQEYWDDNNLAYTYANGGVVQNDLAYLDNNEVIRDVYGNIDQIPNNKPGTDNHLVDASALESVLSNKIKRPSTNKTFAEEGKKLTKMTKPSKGSGVFAENTNKLNVRNANRKYNELLAEQEQVKMSKGTKSKTKSIPTYANGLDGTDGYSTIWNTPYNLGFGRTSLASSFNDINGMTPAGRLPWIPKGDVNTIGTDIPSIDPTIIAKPAGNTSAKRSSSVPAFNRAVTPPVQVFEGELPSLPKVALTAPASPGLFDGELVSNHSKANSKGTKSGKLSGAFDLLDLAPSMYNLVQGIRGPEIEDNILNPYAGAVTGAMARRRMNVNPAMEANRRTRAIANYNAANMNANTGANLAFRTQAAASEYANNADMYATKQNADNAYLGEYANMMNNLGQQFVQGQRLTDDINARNRATGRTFTGTGLGQIGQWNQIRRQERNQASRDEMVYPFLKNFLQYGNPKELIDNMNKQYYGK